MLVISQRPIGAAVRLIVWLGVVVTFYLVALGGGVLSGELWLVDGSTGWHEWLLLLFPLFLVPYLFSLIRALRGFDELTFDQRSKVLSGRARMPVAFAEIEDLQLRTVHGTCEEYCLDAILIGGRRIELFETDASTAVEALAERSVRTAGRRVKPEVLNSARMGRGSLFSDIPRKNRLDGGTAAIKTWVIF
jgi:hypothetical protein